MSQFCPQIKGIFSAIREIQKKRENEREKMKKGIILGVEDWIEDWLDKYSDKIRKILGPVLMISSIVWALWVLGSIIYWSEKR